MYKSQISSGESWKQTGCKGLFGWGPVNDCYQNVCDFISKKVASSPDVEIEVRLGKLVLKEAEAGKDLSRHGLPVDSMCQVNRDRMHTNVRFESGVPHEKLVHFNKLLNNWVNNSKNAKMPPERKSDYPAIRYERTLDIDRFFEIEDSNQRIRETWDPKTGKVKCTIIKEKMGNLEFYMPKADFDFRISASLEKPVPPVAEDRNPDSIRKKDRISYIFECFAIEITTVQSWENPTREVTESIMKQTSEFPPSSRTYEIELEIRDISFLQKQRSLLSNRQRNSFNHICITFFNHCIHLCHTASRTQIPQVCVPFVQKKKHTIKRVNPHALPGHYRPAKKQKRDEEKKD